MNQTVKGWLISCAAGTIVTMGLALPAEWLRHQILRKVSADERCASAQAAWVATQERIAVALEKLVAQGQGDK